MVLNLYQRVTDQILAELERGAAPWVRPWATTGLHGAMPYNAQSKRAYSGVNVLLLWASEYPTPAWLTYKQAIEVGGHVRRGEHGRTVVYMGRARSRPIATPPASPEPDASEGSTYSFLKAYTVFNVAQCDGLPARMLPQSLPLFPEPPVDRNAVVDAFLSAVGATVQHGGDRACFVPALDIIKLPDIAAFKSPDQYYATSFHEHGHWSGAPSRLDRQFGRRFGDQAYAAEELVAELAAAFLCARLGVAGDLRHAGYIDHWIKLLRDDNRAIFTAASKASAAANYLLERGGLGAETDEAELLPIAA